MIGRVVVLPGSEPRARRAPTSRSSARTASVWTTSAGLGWVNPYDRRVWDYARLGGRGRRTRRLRPDHVRLRPLPVRRRRRERRLPGPDERAEGRVIADFVAYAKQRLAPHGSGSRPRSSGSRRRATSASARCRAGSRSTSTTCRRCRTPSSTATASSGIVEPELRARRDGVPDADGLPAPGEGQSRAQLVPWVQDWNYTPRAGARSRSPRHASRARRATCSGTLGALHEGGARAREPRLDG